MVFKKKFGLKSSKNAIHSFSGKLIFVAYNKMVFVVIKKLMLMSIE
jgi:hypothetical protein